MWNMRNNQKPTIEFNPYSEYSDYSEVLDVWWAVRDSNPRLSA